MQRLACPAAHDSLPAILWCKHRMLGTATQAAGQLGRGRRRGGAAAVSTGQLPPVIACLPRCAAACVRPRVVVAGCRCPCRRPFRCCRPFARSSHFACTGSPPGTRIHRPCAPDLGRSCRDRPARGPRRRPGPQPRLYTMAAIVETVAPAPELVEAKAEAAEAVVEGEKPQREQRPREDLTLVPLAEVESLLIRVRDRRGRWGQSGAARGAQSRRRVRGCSTQRSRAARRSRPPPLRTPPQPRRQLQLNFTRPPPAPRAVCRRGGPAALGLPRAEPCPNRHYQKRSAPAQKRPPALLNRSRSSIRYQTSRRHAVHTPCVLDSRCALLHCPTQTHLCVHTGRGWQGEAPHTVLSAAAACTHHPPKISAHTLLQTLFRPRAAR